MSHPAALQRMGKAITDKLAFFQPTRRSVAFALRGIAAALLAMGAALALGYKEIGWAAITVWVLALPRRGMLFYKAFYRVLGSLIGATAAFFLVQLHHNTVLFLILTCVWLSLCAAAANLLRSYQAYAAQLAGFTAPIVAVLAYTHAGEVEDLGIERLVCVLLGIASSTIVTLIFANRIDSKDVEDEARALASQGVKWAANLLDNNQDEAADYNHGLLAKISDLNQFTESAAIESMAIRLRLGAVRRLITAVLSLVSASRAIERLRTTDQLMEFRTVVPLLQEAAAKLARGKAPNEQITTLRTLRPEEAMGADLVSPVLLQVIHDRLLEIAEGLERISDELELILNGPPYRTTAPPIAFHRDVDKAWATGLRTFLAVLASGSLWLGLQWHGGASAFVFTSLACVIFGNKPIPAAGIRGFAYGVGAAVVVFVIWKSLPISLHASFTTTLCVLIFLNFLGAIVLANNVMQGLDFNANISQLMVGPMAPTIIGASAAAIAGLDVLAGITIAYLTYALPPGGEKRREAKLSSSIMEDLKTLAEGRWHPQPHRWEAMMYDRLYQSGLTTSAASASRNGLRHCLLGLDMGLEIIRLRNMLRTEELDEETEREIIQTLAGVGKPHSPGSVKSSSNLQVAGAMETIARCRLLWNAPTGV